MKVHLSLKDWYQGRTLEGREY